MKSLIFSILILVSPIVSEAKIVVGRVNIQKVLVTIKQGKKLRKQLKSVFDKKQKILRKEEDKIRKAQEKFQKQSTVLNGNAKLKKQQEIQKMIMDLQKKSQEFQADIQKRENEAKGPILDRLKTIIEQVSKDASVDLTFEASGASVVYAKDKVELTDKVIKAYDKKFK